MINPTDLNPAPATTNALRTAPMQEIFSSIQGEGVYIGKRQLFLRFAHCHLKCAYCDTPMTSSTGQCHVELEPGTGEMSYYPNPMTPAALTDLCREMLAKAPHHSISFTGGEPLLYHSFLAEALPDIQPLCPIYLETSGTQREFLDAIFPWVDIIAMDIKLPSATKEAPQFDNHARFYERAREKDCFIKLVFNEHTTAAELAAVRDIVTDRDTPIILQPETSLIDKRVSIPPRRIYEIEQALVAHFSDVRVIPQTHKMLNVL